MNGNRRSLIMQLAGLLVTVSCGPSAGSAKQLRQQSQKRPIILWITIEDWSPELSFHSTKGFHTQHIDKPASEGFHYLRAFTTSPVCSTSHSVMMTRCHQNYIGVNQHREHNKKPLPYGVKPIPHLFQEAGYFTALMIRKTDCNFTPNKKEYLFMEEDMTERNEGQPFYDRISFSGHLSRIPLFE